MPIARFAFGTVFGSAIVAIGLLSLGAHQGIWSLTLTAKTIVETYRQVWGYPWHVMGGERFSPAERDVLFLLFVFLFPATFGQFQWKAGVTKSYYYHNGSPHGWVLAQAAPPMILIIGVMSFYINDTKNPYYCLVLLLAVPLMSTVASSSPGHLANNIIGIAKNVLGAIFIVASLLSSGVAAFIPVNPK